MELTWRHLLYLAIILAVLLALYLWAMRPAPDVTGGSCNSVCTSKIVDTEYQDEWNSTICGADNCLIEEIHYVVGGLYQIKCKCCECQGTAGKFALGECAYGNPLFDWMGSIMGFCKIGD